MVAVRNQDGTSGDCTADRHDPSKVVDTLDSVHHTVLVGALADQLAGFAQEIGETDGQRQTPDGGEVAARRSGEIEPVGLGLGRRSLVRQDPVGTFVDDLQCADDPDGVSVTPELIDELHAVQRQRR